VLRYPPTDCTPPVDTPTLSSMLSPKPALCGHKFQLKVDECIYLGHPVLVDASPSDVHDDMGALQMSMFNAVVILPVGTSQQALDDTYRHIVEPLAMALRNAQHLNAHVRHQCELVLALRDDAHLDDVACALYCVGVCITTIACKEVFQRALEQSLLVRCLVTLYDSLQANRPAPVHLAIDDNLLTLTIQPPPLLYNTSSSPVDEKNDTNQDLEPYHTLLLLDDVDVILATLPPDASPLFSQFISLLSPRRTCVRSLINI
jgi:hypothetical protein